MALEASLLERENSTFGAKMAASTASSEASSKSALRAALLEGEIDRCERESSALSEEIASLRAELTQNEGQFAVATDRCELSIEKSRIEEEHLKQTDAALSVVTGRLAAISAALGRIQPLNADLVGALRQKVDVARSQQAEAVRHRKRLEMDVHNTQKMLDGALGHLDELLALSREEEKKTIVDALRSFGSAPPSRKGEIHVEQVLLAAQARPWYSEQGQVAVRRSHTATEESTQEMNSNSNGGAYTEGRQLRPKYTAAAVGSSAATSGGEEQPPRDNSNRVFFSEPDSKQSRHLIRGAFEKLVQSEYKRSRHAMAPTTKPKEANEPEWQQELGENGGLSPSAAAGAGTVSPLQKEVWETEKDFSLRRKVRSTILFLPMSARTIVFSLLIKRRLVNSYLCCLNLSA